MASTGTTDTIEGWNSVLEALRAHRPMNKVLIARDLGRHSNVAEVIGVAKSQGVILEWVDRRILDRLSITRMHQGVLGMVSIKAYAEPAHLLEAARRRGEAPLLVALDGVVDPQNLGAIIRTVEGSGAHGVMIPQRRAAGLTAAVSRASAGAVEYVPVARVSNMSGSLAQLRRDGIWTVGLVPSGSQEYSAVDYRKPTALVLGAEGKGLSNLVRNRCDMLVSIPMRGNVASLNVSVAAGLVLYEAVRQRRA